MRLRLALGVGLGAAAAAIATAVVGCLPGDTRPAPGSILVTVAPSPDTTHGFTTADGWRITFDRLLVGLGDVGFHGDDDGCTSYGEAHYTKLFDFAAPEAASPQKVGIIYGLGHCSLAFELHPPSSDAPLTTGVSKADVEAMNLEQRDLWITESAPSVVEVVGHATKGATTKHFDWRFRQRLDMHDCPMTADPDAGVVTDLDLNGHDAEKIEISIHGEELFRVDAEDNSGFGFGTIAHADTDNDGNVTLNELLGQAPSATPSGLVDAGIRSEADLLYLALLPRIAHLGGGPCQTEVHEHH